MIYLFGFLVGVLFVMVIIQRKKHDKLQVEILQNRIRASEFLKERLDGARIEKENATSEAFSLIPTKKISNYKAGDMIRIKRQPIKMNLNKKSPKKKKK